MPSERQDPSCLVLLPYTDLNALANLVLQAQFDANEEEEAVYVLGGRVIAQVGDSEREEQLWSLANTFAAIKDDKSPNPIVLRCSRDEALLLKELIETASGKGHTHITDWESLLLTIERGLHDLDAQRASDAEKEWVVLSSMGTTDNEGTLEKWFETQEEAHAWVQQIEIERPAKYYVKHQTELDESY